MTITREDVADLQPGDVVEVTHEDWPEGTVVRGPLWLMDGETLQVSRIVVKHWDGHEPFDTGLSLTVISRAPRALYVNHPRTEPVAGDVVRTDDGRVGGFTYLFTRHERYAGVEPVGRMTRWVSLQYGAPDTGPLYAKKLTLLIDGATGLPPAVES